MPEPKDWNRAHDRALTYPYLSGTSWAEIYMYGLQADNDLPFLTKEMYEFGRHNKKRSIRRSLNSFRRGEKDGKENKSKYSPLTEEYNPLHTFRLKQGTLRPFTTDMYKSQFPAYQSQQSALPSFLSSPNHRRITQKQSTMPLKNKSPKKNIVSRGRSMTPKHEDDSIMSSIAGQFSNMGIDKKNSKFAIVDHEDESWDDIFKLTEGIDNPKDIYVKLLVETKLPDGSMRMHCLQVIYPLDNLNPYILNTKANLVRLKKDNRKGIHLVIPSSLKRFDQDKCDIAKFSNAAFGVHDGREEGMNATFIPKLEYERRSKSKVVHKNVLLILPEKFVDEDAEDPNEATMYSNCEFNATKGKEPTDGKLLVLPHVSEGNITTNCLRLGRKIFPVTAYIECQVAIDGTQEALKPEDSDDESVDPLKFFEARDAALNGQGNDDIDSIDEYMPEEGDEASSLGGDDEDGRHGFENNDHLSRDQALEEAQAAEEWDAALAERERQFAFEEDTRLKQAEAERLEEKEKATAWNSKVNADLNDRIVQDSKEKMLRQESRPNDGAELNSYLIEEIRRDDLRAKKLKATTAIRDSDDDSNAVASTKFAHELEMKAFDLKQKEAEDFFVSTGEKLHKVYEE